MLKVFKGIKTIVKLVIVAFIVVVLVGIYMALNAAPSASIRASEAQCVFNDTGLGSVKLVDVSGFVSPGVDDLLDGAAGAGWRSGGRSCVPGEKDQYDANPARERLDYFHHDG